MPTLEQQLAATRKCLAAMHNPNHIYIGNLHRGFAHTLPMHVPAPRRISVERGASSPVSNPWFLREEEDRNAVCDAYAIWLTAPAGTQVSCTYPSSKGKNTVMHEMTPEKRKAMDDELYRLLGVHLAGDMILLCWCIDPKLPEKRCHAQAIREWILAEEQAALDEYAGKHRDELTP